MRIQGELLKLGIGVSPTTIAAVLRSSGLGPAPRRIGPSWSEFLRAQAHSMLGGGLRDSFDGDTFEPIGWPRIERPARWKPTTTWRQRLSGLSWLLNRCRLGAARCCRDSGSSLRLEDRHACSPRIDRTLATDPRAGRPLVPQPNALARALEGIAARIPRPRAKLRVGPPRQPPGILNPAASVRPIRPPFRVARVNRVSYP
jgi:hypothetical protein